MWSSLAIVPIGYSPFLRPYMSMTSSKSSVLILMHLSPKLLIVRWRKGSYLLISDDQPTDNVGSRPLSMIQCWASLFCQCACAPSVSALALAVFFLFYLFSVLFLLCSPAQPPLSVLPTALKYNDIFFNFYSSSQAARICGLQVRETVIHSES